MKTSLLAILAAACSLGGIPAFAQTTLTTVADTVHVMINGQPAVGSMSISSPSFQEPDGTYVTSSTKSVHLSSTGAFSVQLYPTTTASSNGVTGGVLYTVTYNLNNGSSLQEQWNVPVSAGALTISKVLVAADPELRGPSGTTLPATCNQGDVFTMLGQGLYVCLSTNNWVGLQTGPEANALYLPLPNGSGLVYYGSGATRPGTANDVTATLGFTPMNPANSLSEISGTAAAARGHLGLGNIAVDDESKFLQMNQLGAHGGAAQLGSDGLVNPNELPALSTFSGSLNLSQLLTTGTPSSTTYLNGVGAWGQIPYSAIGGTPVIPTDDASLANGAGYAKSSDISHAGLTGNYSDLLGLPTLGTIAKHAEGDYLSSTGTNAANGALVLDGGGKVPLNLLPPIPSTDVTGLGTASALDATTLLLKSAVGQTVAPLVSGYVPLSLIPTIDYHSLANLPNIPTDDAQIGNSAGYVNANGASAASPVQGIKVNGGSALTGTVALTIPTDDAALGNGAGYVTLAQSQAGAPVQSVTVNGAKQTGDVSVTVPTDDASIGNSAGYVTAATSPVRSVNGQTGIVVIPSYLLPAASPTSLGGVICGANLSCASDGTISAASAYVLPPATGSTLGGFIVGSDLLMDGTTHALSVDASKFDAAGAGQTAAAGTLKATNNLSDVGNLAATQQNLGLAPVAINGGDYNSLINKPTIPAAYTLPVASTTVLGGVKCGTNLTCASDGTMSAQNSYVLPAATTSVIGGVIPSQDILVNGSGVISIDESKFDLAGTAVAQAGNYLQKANNLGDLTNVATAQTNLHLPASAISGSFNDLSNKPVLGTIAKDNEGDYIATTQRGIPGGVALLDGTTGTLVANELPTINIGSITGTGNIVTHNASDFLAATLLNANSGVAGLGSDGKLVSGEVPVIAYGSLSGAPDLKPLATSALYSDLIGAPAGLPPIGAVGAGSDLSGTYPAPTVKGINGTTLSSLGAGILKINSSGIPSIAGTSDITAAFGYTPLNAALNLQDVASPATSRTNLGLGDMALETKANYLLDPGTAGFLVRTTQGHTSTAGSGDLITLLGFTPINQTLIGAANGLATLDGNKLLTAAQLPPVPFADVTGVPNFINSSAIGVTVAPLVSGLIPSNYIPAQPLATTSTAGEIIVGGNLLVSNGTLSVNAAAFDAAGTATSQNALDLKIASNLGDVANAAAARTNLGLATVAATGAYADLSGKPTLSAVALSGSFNDLSNKPFIPTKVSDLTNDAGYLTTATLNPAKTNALGSVMVPGPYLQVDSSGSLTAHVGNNAGELAAADDPRIVGALQSTQLGQANGPAALDATGRLQVQEFPSNIPASDITGLGTASEQSVAFFLQASQLGQGNGVAPLGAQATVPLQYIPTIPYTQISGTPAAYVLPAATSSALGGVKIGTGLGVDGAGLASVQFGTSANQALQGNTLGQPGGPAILDGSGHLTNSELAAGTAGGLATLDGGGKLSQGQIPTSGIAATAIDNGEVSAQMFSYLSGVTSPIQTQLNGVIKMANGSGAGLTYYDGSTNQLQAVNSGSSLTGIIPAPMIANGSVSNAAFEFIAGLTANALQLGSGSVSGGGTSSPSDLASAISALGSASSGVQNVVFIGDSLTRCFQGTGANCPGTGPTNQSSLYWEALKTYIHSHYGNHGDGLVPIQAQIVGQVDPFYTISNPTGTSSTNYAGSVSGFGPYQNSPSTGGSLYDLEANGSITATGSGDNVRIYWTEGNNSGAGFTVTVDGSGAGTYGQGTTGGASGVATVSLGSNGSHTVQVHVPNTADAQEFFHGFEFTSGSTGVSITNEAFGYCRAECFGANASVNMEYVDQLSGGRALDIIMLGTNDLGGDVNTYKTNLTNVINHEKTKGVAGIVVMAPPFAGISTGSGMSVSDMATAAQQVASSEGVDFYNSQTLFGSLSSMQSSGYINSDNVHLSDSGQQLLGTSLTTHIFGSGGGGSVSLGVGQGVAYYSGSGNAVGTISVSAAALGYINNLRSDVQAQLDSLSASIGAGGGGGSVSTAVTVTGSSGTGYSVTSTAADGDAMYGATNSAANQWRWGTAGTGQPNTPTGSWFVYDPHTNWFPLSIDTSDTVHIWSSGAASNLVLHNTWATGNAQIDFENDDPAGYEWQIGIGGSGMAGAYGVNPNQLFFLDTKAGEAAFTVTQGTEQVNFNGQVKTFTGFAVASGDGITGTATSGGCTLTIAGGIITGKSGC